jgi:hypothetical protein
MLKQSYHLSGVVWFVLITSVFLGSPLRLNAQGVSSPAYLREYVFIAPATDTMSTGTQSAYAAGGGIEQLLPKQFGAGLDLQALIPGSGKANRTIGVASFDGSFHPIFKPTWDLFVTGGYSFIFRDFTANGFNFGGGVNYWVRENKGVTLELREVAGKHTPQLLENHYLEIRIGITFR